jgi:hypothetical protein
MQPVRETTAARPYISAVTPMSTLTRAAGALDAQRPGCSSGEHGPCPAHGGSVPGEETRDLTGMMSRPLQAVPNLEAQR